MKHKSHYRTLRRFSIMQSPIQWEETLGQCVRGDRFTGGRKAAREEATGPSQKRRMTRAIRQAIASRAPTGRVTDRCAKAVKFFRASIRPGRKRIGPDQASVAGGRPRGG